MIFSTVPARVALVFSAMACPLVFQSDLPLVRRFPVPRSAICPDTSSLPASASPGVNGPSDLTRDLA